MLRRGTNLGPALFVWGAAVAACNRSDALEAIPSCVEFPERAFSDFAPADNRPAASPWARSGPWLAGGIGRELRVFALSSAGEPRQVSSLELGGDVRQAQFVGPEDAPHELIVAVSKAPVLDAGELPVPESRRPVDTLLRVDLVNPEHPTVTAEQTLSGRFWQFAFARGALWVLEALPTPGRCDFDGQSQVYASFRLTSYRQSSVGFRPLEQVALAGRSLAWLLPGGAVASSARTPVDAGELSFAAFGDGGAIASQGTARAESGVAALSLTEAELRVVSEVDRGLELTRYALEAEGVSASTNTQVGVAEHNGGLRASFVDDWLFVSRADRAETVRAFALAADDVLEVEVPEGVRDWVPLPDLRPVGAGAGSSFALGWGAEPTLLEVTNDELRVLARLEASSQRLDGPRATGNYLVFEERAAGRALYRAFRVSAAGTQAKGSFEAENAPSQVLGDVLVTEDGGLWHAWESAKTTRLTTLGPPVQLAVAAGHIATIRYRYAVRPVLTIARLETPNELLLETELADGALLGAGDHFFVVRHAEGLPLVSVFTTRGTPHLVAELSPPGEHLGPAEGNAARWHSGADPALLADGRLVLERERSGASSSSVAHVLLNLPGVAGVRETSLPFFSEPAWSSQPSDGQSGWGSLTPAGDAALATRVARDDTTNDTCGDRVFVEVLRGTDGGALEVDEPLTVRGAPVATPPGSSLEDGSPYLLSLEAAAPSDPHGLLHRTRLVSGAIETVALPGLYPEVRAVGDHAVVLTEGGRACGQPDLLTTFRLAGSLTRASTLELPADDWSLVSSDAAHVLLQAGGAARTFSLVRVERDGTLRLVSTKHAHCLGSGRDPRPILSDGVLYCSSAHGIERVAF